MPQAGNINVTISADVEQFQKGLQKAVASLSQWTAGLTGVATFAANLAADGVKSVVSSLADFTKESFTSIDKMNDLSNELQTNINDLRAYGYAAQLSGASAEEMNDALRKMQKQIGEASAGNEDAINTFRALGLNIENLRQQSATQNFRDIAQSISGIDAPAEKAAAALAVFGKSGQGMINTLNMGALGLDQMQSEFGNLRASLTDAEVSGVARFNDSLDSMREIIGGIGDAFAVYLAPYLTGAIEQFKAFIGTGPQIKASIGGGLDWVIKMTSKLVDTTQLFRALWYNMIEVLAEMKLGFIELERSIVRVLAKVGILKESDNKIWDKISANANNDVTNARNQAQAATNDWMNATAAKGYEQWLAELKAAGSTDWFKAFYGLAGSAGSAGRPGINRFVTNNDNKNWFKNSFKEFEEMLKPSWFKKSFSEITKQVEDSTREFADKIKDSLKTPTEKFEEFSAKVLDVFGKGLITGDQAEKAIKDQADALGKKKQSGGARAIDSFLAVEGLRMNKKSETQTVTDPKVHELLGILIGTIKSKDSLAKVG